MKLRATWIGLCLSLPMLAVSTSASAWSEVTRFTDPPAGGGGGWRFFTGSPGDSFTCANCHTGPSGLRMAVYGLPKTYMPGATYEVAVTWTAGVSHVAGMLEIVDELGEAAGQFSVLDPADADPASLCEGNFSPMTVFTRTPTAAGMRRQVLGATSCEATRVQARWKAPDRDVGAVMLVGGFVRPDDKPEGADPTPENDQVTLLHHAIASPSEPTPPAPSQTFGCQLGIAKASSGAGRWALLFLVAMALRGRRRAARWTP